MYGSEQVMEVRKFHKYRVQGEQDLKSGIEGLFIGRLEQAAACTGTGYSCRALGVRIHLKTPCSASPFC